MHCQDELSVILPHYLRERHQLSEDAVHGLNAEWNEQGSLVEFLVGKGLLTRPTARALDAVRKGHFKSPLASVLGMTKNPLGPSLANDEESWGYERFELELAVTSPQVMPIARPRAPQLRSRVMRPETGMQLGRFTLQEQLGAGFAGTVFRSFHPTLSIPVAIKVFAPFDGAAAADARQRFLHEAQTLARLQHPNIVRILEVVIDEQLPYLVLEYVGERTLLSQIQTLSKLPAARIAQIGSALADALEFTWQHGLLHRDVKPANILERRDGRIKLGDFGLSAERTATGGLSDPEAALGYISGTPSFIAPEQALTPSDIDFRADMYGLGATLYHAAVGFPPFSAATAHDTIMAQLNEEPVPITDLDPGFDRHLAAAIHRMLQRDRQDRFSSWAQARAALN